MIKKAGMLVGLLATMSGWANAEESAAVFENAITLTAEVQRIGRSPRGLLIIKGVYGSPIATFHITITCTVGNQPAPEGAIGMYKKDGQNCYVYLSDAMQQREPAIKPGRVTSL